jgi:hypothetical protein
MKILLIISTLFFLQETEPKAAYICLNKTSEVYHFNKECRGLKRCTHEVLTTNEKDAKEKYGKLRLCGYESQSR